MKYKVILLFAILAILLLGGCSARVELDRIGTATPIPTAPQATPQELLNVAAQATQSAIMQSALDASQERQQAANEHALTMASRQATEMRSQIDAAAEGATKRAVRLIWNITAAAVLLLLAVGGIVWSMRATKKTEPNKLIVYKAAGQLRAYNPAAGRSEVITAVQARELLGVGYEQ